MIDNTAVLTKHAQPLIRVPAVVAAMIDRMREESITGQVILNFNRGDMQSCEAKEHVRL